MTTPNIETVRNKCVETCMLFNHLRSSHDHVDAHLLRRRARLAAYGAPPSSPGLRAVAVIVLHVVGSLILASLTSLLLAASSGPGEVFCPRGVLEASLGFMIDGHQNTSCDKTLRSRKWLHDLTGFMASSINCRFEGTTLALHDIKKKTQPARRDGTCSSALRPRFLCVASVAESSSSFQPLISVMAATAAKTVLFENASVGDNL